MSIDTHRHLGGSIPCRWVWETIEAKNLRYLAETEEEVHQAMCFSPNEKRNFHRFLDKFRILDGIPWDEGLIDSSIKAICEQLEHEDLDYCWLDFSINKYMNIGWHKKEAIKFVSDAFERYRPGKVGLILSLKYESTQASQRQHAQLIDDPDIADIIMGIDLVGDEDHISYDFHGAILSDWAKHGKMVRAHVGEFGPADNIKAVLPHVTNIAHGIKIVESPDIVAECLDRGICFDLGISSNFYSGVVAGSSHPVVKMVELGLTITLGSDDPVTCNTSLKDEFTLASELGVSDQQLSLMRLNAALNSNY
jgi:adenosine deaminase